MKKKLPILRQVRNHTVCRTFERLGYSYKARRRNAAVAEKHKPARLAYCDWVEKQDQEDLDDWSYVDGTSIYLATHEAQHLDKQRGSPGRSVWRLTDGSDSLEDKNVGGSSYAKSQGKPVKIWGLLADGHLEYWLLPEKRDKKGRKKSVNMTGALYNQMVKKHFPAWKKKMFPRKCWTWQQRSTNNWATIYGHLPAISRSIQKYGETRALQIVISNCWNDYCLLFGLEIADCDIDGLVEVDTPDLD